MLPIARGSLYRGVSRLDVRLGVRIALSAVLAMIAAKLMHISAFYWAGISAIVVSTGTPGGSFSASLARFSGTLVGLASGTLMVLLLGHSLTAAALAILLAILLCQALGLKAAVRVAALSTLFPCVTVTDQPGLAPVMATVASRAGNVIVGCLMTLVMDGLLWPERSSVKLLARIRSDVGGLGRMASDLVMAYLSGSAPPADARLVELQAGRLTYAELLKEMGAEPEDPDAPRDALADQAEAVHLLVDHCAALRDIHQQRQEDRAADLMRADLERFAAHFCAAAEAFAASDPAFPERMLGLRRAHAHMETAYEAVRGDRGTQAFPSAEIFRLLGVLYHCGALARELGRMAPRPESQGLSSMSESEA
ncbi:MAG TPA: FUSC family protein [Holophaga sp.]|nr:FUSC family protein [Holophaga sp.]